MPEVIYDSEDPRCFNTTESMHAELQVKYFWGFLSTGGRVSGSAKKPELCINER